MGDMLIASAIFFGGGLLGLVALFSVKYHEQMRGVELEAQWRAFADQHAHDVKHLLAQLRHEASELYPKVGVMLRTSIHAGAMSMASVARWIEMQAQKLADMVSHKHHFQHRETRSDFLKQVSDYKRH